MIEGTDYEQEHVYHLEKLGCVLRRIARALEKLAGTYVERDGMKSCDDCGHLYEGAGCPACAL